MLLTIALLVIAAAMGAFDVVAGPLGFVWLILALCLLVAGLERLDPHARTR